MGRGDRQGRFRPPPVERIELDEEHLRRRFMTAGVLLLFGAALLAYAVMKFLTPAAGWQVIQANSTGEASCAEEITFLYEAASPAEVKAAAARYTDACQRAYRLFHCRQEFEAVVNVCTLNRRPNEVLAVDGALYEALATAVGGGRRELYLGPIYARYGDLFFCQDDAQLANYDPRLSADVAREYQEVLAYANDPQSIEVELLGENQVRLRVSEAYLAYAEREGIDRFIDFAWMQDAFVVDLLAGELEAGGFTKGVLSSYDGFTRNLDSREGSYEYPLYHRQDGEVQHGLPAGFPHQRAGFRAVLHPAQRRGPHTLPGHGRRPVQKRGQQPAVLWEGEGLRPAPDGDDPGVHYGGFPPRGGCCHGG